MDTLYNLIPYIATVAFWYYLLRKESKKTKEAFQYAEMFRVLWHEENIAHQKTKAELEQYKNHQSEA